MEDVQCLKKVYALLANYRILLDCSDTAYQYSEIGIETDYILLIQEPNLH